MLEGPFSNQNSSESSAEIANEVSSKPKIEESVSRRDSPEDKRREEELLRSLRDSEAQAREFLERVRETRRMMKSESFESEKEPGTISMLVNLWKNAPADARGSLLKEFLLYPGQLKDRYYREQEFKSRLERGWKGLKR